MSIKAVNRYFIKEISFPVWAGVVRSTIRSLGFLGRAGNENGEHVFDHGLLSIPSP
jgi:hypothetical protein